MAAETQKKIRESRRCKQKHLMKTWKSEQLSTDRIIPSKVDALMWIRWSGGYTGLFDIHDCLWQCIVGEQ